MQHIAGVYKLEGICILDTTYTYTAGIHCAGAHMKRFISLLYVLYISSYLPCAFIFDSALLSPSASDPLLLSLPLSLRCIKSYSQFHDILAFIYVYIICIYINSEGRRAVDFV